MNRVRPSWKLDAPKRNTEPRVMPRGLIPTQLIPISAYRYYATLQKVLESYDCVLYEMLAKRESLESRRNPANAKKLKGSRSRFLSTIRCIQWLMARLIKLDLQGDWLHYRAENWYHADLDYETFKQLKHERGERFFRSSRDKSSRSTKAKVSPPSYSEELGPWRFKLKLFCAKLLAFDALDRTV